MSFARTTIGFVLLSCAAIPAHAQAADAADELVQLLAIERKLDAVFTDLAPLYGSQVVAQFMSDKSTSAIVSNLVTNGRGGRERLEAILSEQFLLELRKSYPTMIAEVKSAYGAALAPNEVKATVDFLKSPAGQKFLAAEVTTQEQIKGAGQRAGMTAGMAAASAGFARAQREMLGESQ